MFFVIKKIVKVIVYNKKAKSHIIRGQGKGDLTELSGLYLYPNTTEIKLEKKRGWPNPGTAYQHTLIQDNCKEKISR